MPTSAPADQIHLAVSPAVPAKFSEATLQVSGEDAEVGSSVLIGMPLSESEPCHVKPEGERGLEPHPVEAPGFSYQQPYFADPGFSEHICGYVIHAGSTTAMTELRVSLGPSELEVKQAEREVSERKALEEETRANEQSAAQRAKAQEEYDQAPQRAEQHEAEIAQANAHAVQAKRAEVAASEARIVSAHKTPITRLTVRANPRAKGSSRSPGYTELLVTTNPYAYVTVQISRHGHSTEHFEWGEEATAVAAEVSWSCKIPGGVYHYTVTARSRVGASLVRRGVFRPVSVARCHSLEHREAVARERSARQYEEGIEREVRERRETLERFEANCRAEGGTVVTLQISEGSERGCRSPNGGLLSVPR